MSNHRIKLLKERRKDNTEKRSIKQYYLDVIIKDIYVLGKYT